MGVAFYDELRKEYSGTVLTKENAGKCPKTLLEGWLKQAIAAKEELSNAASLSTVSGEGKPRSRMVLVKGISDSGLLFFSNFSSAKFTELKINPNTNLLFWWPSLHRQVRIEGVVKNASDATSDDYFSQRSRASNISAIASPQSEEVENRDVLLQKWKKVEKTHTGHDLVRPSDWGGALVVPERYEFFQGHEDRLHDRIVFERNGSNTWLTKRLAP